MVPTDIQMTNKLKSAVLEGRGTRASVTNERVGVPCPDAVSHGQSWPAALRAALRKSAVAVCVSKAFLLSLWRLEECLLFSVCD